MAALGACEIDIVPAFHELRAPDRVYLKGHNLRAHPHLASHQINLGGCGSRCNQRVHICNDRWQKPVIDGIGCENLAKAWRKDRAEPGINQPVHGGLPRRPAAEIAPRNQD